MSNPRIGHTEGGHSFTGGDPSDSINWKKIGVNEDGFSFSGGDPSKKDNWSPVIDKEEEASLGFANRAQYALEPIQSNRKAFLEKEFGQENIMEDKSGELYLKQNGSFLPLNKGGVSMADAADFLGATPEIAGGVVGTVAGAVGGAGVASVPAAIGLGAAGGAVGSGIRQGISAMIGTPQVATAGERALETGLSAAFGGVGAGVGIAAKAGINKVKPGISQIIKNMKGAGKEVTESVGETTTKTISNSNIGIDGAIEFTPSGNTEKSIMGNVADQSERALVKAESDKLSKIALEENLPAPSIGQASMGKTIIAENQVMDMPFIGSNVRKRADDQVKKLTENLEGFTGRKIDADSDAFEVGQSVREFAETSLEVNKKIAQELYQKIEEDGAEAMIGKGTLFNKFRNKAGDLGLITPEGLRSKFAFDTGLTRTQFIKLQDTLFDVIDGLKNNPSSKIRFSDANAATKMIKAAGKESKVSDANIARILSDFGHELNDSMVKTLNRESPELGKVFLEANQRWAKHKTQEKALNKLLGPNISHEKVVQTIMSGTHRIDELKELIGGERVKEMAKSYVADILFKVSKSGVGAADNARNALRKSAPQIKAALGEDSYRRIMNNLHYLNSTGRSLTVSRASLLSFLDFKTNGISGAVVKLGGMAKTIAESKGTTVTRAVKDKVFETTGKIVPTTDRGFSQAGNILSDGTQRSLSYLPKTSASAVTQREKEAEKRKRAISGSK